MLSEVFPRHDMQVDKFQLQSKKKKSYTYHRQGKSPQALLILPAILPETLGIDGANRLHRLAGADGGFLETVQPQQAPEEVWLLKLHRRPSDHGVALDHPDVGLPQNGRACLGVLKSYGH